MKKINFEKIPTMPEAAAKMMSMAMKRLSPKIFEPQIAAAILQDLSSLTALMGLGESFSGNILKLAVEVGKIEKQEQMTMKIVENIAKTYNQIIKITEDYEEWLENRNFANKKPMSTTVH